MICPRRAATTAPTRCLEGIHVYRHPLPVEAEGRAGATSGSTHRLSSGSSRSRCRCSARHGFDAIHACNPPDDIFLIGLFFKLFGKRFVFDHHDINPELYEAKFGRAGFFCRLMRLFERRTFRAADVSIATNESYRRIALERGGMAPERVFVVRSGPSLERLRILPPEPRLKRGRAFLVGYVGVMGEQEGIALLLEAARRSCGDPGGRTCSSRWSAADLRSRRCAG